VNRALFLSALAVLTSGRPAASAKEQRPVTDSVSVTCTLTRQGGTLRVAYTVRNNGPERVFILDDMVRLADGAYQRTPRVIIVQQEAPGRVALVRGFVDPGHPVQIQYAPAARALDPGQSLTGTAEVPLPLRAQHPYGRPVPLSGPVTSAVLVIGYLTGKVDWVGYPVAGAGTLSAPALQSVVSRQRLARSAPMPVPAS
jgi:hypothetical protein